VSCHQPERLPGDRIRIVRDYADDEANTENVTTLHVSLGEPTSGGASSGGASSGGASSGEPSVQRAIHWHANPAIRVEYVATDAKRETIPWIRVTDAQGRAKEYVAPNAPANVATSETAGGRRTMDCIDCHNTVGHPMAATPERAVDGAIARGLIDRQLPFVRRESVRLVNAPYVSHDEAARAIDSGLRGFYKSRGEIDGRALARSVAALQEVYRRNVFPEMKVTWGAYPNNLGHVTSTGCFRCHDGEHAALDGSVISADCESCHK
jgi:hypothetical protein